MVITNIDYSNRFLEVLQYLQSTYEKFPKFLIEIIAENFGIPSSEVKNLIYMFRKKGILKILKDEGYYFRFEQSI